MRLPRDHVLHQPLIGTLFLQKELMEQAQEIFRTANKATRPEKEHILKFMAGTRGSLVFILPNFEKCISE